MNNKVNFLRGTSAEYESSIKDNDTFYYTTDTKKLYLGDKEITGGNVTIDDTLSDTSKNPVQNKVVNAALNSKADQTTVDNALAQKANSADVTASLAGKSDTGHTHDDRYYTESETDALLGDKVGESDFNSHTNNTTVHVTAEEKADWNGKAELSDIPTSLPANGGNADTLDGKHADNFIYARGILDSINLDDIKYPCSALALNCINSPTSQWGTLLVYAGGTDSIVQIYIPTVSDGTPTAMYFRHYGGTGWTTWRNTADGGNAATVGNKGLAELMNYGFNYTDRLRIETGDLNNYTSGGRFIVVTTAESGAITHSPWTNTGYFLDVYRRADSYVIQIAMNWIGEILIRYIAGNNNWSEWVNLKDGGNALTATYASYANYAGTLANTASNICLRSLSSGTADVNTTVCPTGAWYGKYE